MKKLIFTIMLMLAIPLSGLYSQAVYYTQSFEDTDSTSLPAGWSHWNMRWFPINPMTNWTVRDSGLHLPNLTSALSKAVDGKRACITTWGASIDTNSKMLNLLRTDKINLGSKPLIDTAACSDVWLVSKQFRNIPGDAFLSFWACGGSASYMDSLQIWVTTSDSLPNNFAYHLETEVWPAGSTYGNYVNYLIDLSQFVGQNIRIGFRYYMDCTVDGYCVMVDKFEMMGTIGIKPIGTNVPDKYELSQNYPNPFNPVTKIKFAVPKAGFAKLEVFNSIGQLVQVLHSGNVQAGYYETQFSGASLTSGVYFYKLTSNGYTETKKMILVK